MSAEGASGWRRRVVAVIAVAVALPLAGLLLVTATGAVPDRLIADRLGDAVLARDLTADDYIRGNLGERIDRFSECISITMGLGDEVGRDAVSKAIGSSTLGNCRAAVPRLERWLDGQPLTSGWQYYRYWHGASVVLRPAIGFLGLVGARLAIAVGLFVSLVLAVRGVARVGNLTIALVLFTPLVLTTDFVDLWLSLPHAVAMTMILLCVAGLTAVPATWSRVRFFTAAVVAGAAFVFVDVLFNPAAAWSLCAFSLGLVMIGARARRSEVVVRMALATGGWLVGYAWMWFSKWVLAAIRFGPAAVRANVVDAIALRVDGEVPATQRGLLAALGRNVQACWHQPLSGATVAVLVGVLLVLAWRYRSLRWDRARLGPLVLAAPAVLPALWFLFARNHSVLHVWFTYRSVAVAVGMVLAAVAAVLVGFPRTSGVTAPAEADVAASEGVR